MDHFLQVCQDCKSWPSVSLLTLLSDARGARAAVLVLPSTGEPTLLREGGAHLVQLPGAATLWLLPSRFEKPRNDDVPPVPVDLYALAYGFFLYPLSKQVRIHHWLP